MSEIYRQCLLLEDDPEDQEFFLSTFNEVCPDGACYAVSNGAEALEILSKGDFRPDVIFTDLNMPKMDGLAFLRALKASQGPVHPLVVVYTGSLTPTVVEDAMRHGAAGAFNKSGVNSLRHLLQRFVRNFTPNAVEYPSGE